MKKLLTYLYNHIFRRNKSFIVWSNKHSVQFNSIDLKDYVYFVWFTYTIEFYPYRSNKYQLKCTPKSRQFESPRVYANETIMYQEALEKLQEFQSSELIDLITLPKIEGVKQ